MLGWRWNNLRNILRWYSCGFSKLQPGRRHKISGKSYHWDKSEQTLIHKLTNALMNCTIPRIRMSLSLKFTSNPLKTSAKSSSKTNLSHNCMICHKPSSIGCSISMKFCTESTTLLNQSITHYQMNTISKSWLHNLNHNTSVKSFFSLYCCKPNTTSRCMPK